MYNGIINIYKPLGMSSYDVIRRLKKILGMKKIGHTGTLDPQAEGVLPVCLGKATKVSELLMDAKKQYRAVMRLGVITDTQDLTGEILRENEVDVDEETIHEVMAEFRGEIMQVPPMYSALKRGGVPLYKLARKGEEVERSARKVTIFDMEILDVTLPMVMFLVECSKGTYIRTLCHDIGERLGCGACMAQLRREAVGDFVLADSVKLEELEGVSAASGFMPYITPIDSVFTKYDKITLDKAQEFKVRNGSAIPFETPEGIYRVYAEDGEFLAVSRVENGVLKLVKAFYS